MGETMMHVETLVRKVLRKQATVFGRLRRASSIILTLPSSKFTVPPCSTFRSSADITHNVSFLYVLLFHIFSNV
jgi:hypothetical protein